LAMFKKNFNLPAQAAGLSSLVSDLPFHELNVSYAGGQLFPGAVVTPDAVAVDGSGGDTRTLNFVLNNRGSTPLVIQSLSLERGSRGFSILNAPAAGTRLIAGTSATLSVRF